MDQNENVMDVTFDELEEVNVTELEPTRGSSGLGGKIALGVGALVLTGIGIAVAKREKIKELKEQKEIRRMEKKGYVVLKAENVEIHEADVEEDEDFEEE